MLSVVGDQKGKFNACHVIWELYAHSWKLFPSALFCRQQCSRWRKKLFIIITVFVYIFWLTSNVSGIFEIDPSEMTGFESVKGFRSTLELYERCSKESPVRLWGKFAPDSEWFSGHSNLVGFGSSAATSGSKGFLQAHDSKSTVGF